MSDWTLFSNHGHVLVCLSRNSEARLRDVALDVGITERAVQKIVRDLQDGDMISVTKNGRRNSYRILRQTPLRHDLESTCTLKDLIKFVNKDCGSEQDKSAGKDRSGSSPTSMAGSKAISEPNPAKVRKKKPVKRPMLDVGAVSKDSTKSGNEEAPQEASKERQQGFLF